jgi:hypothetical protein
LKFEKSQGSLQDKERTIVGGRQGWNVAVSPYQDVLGQKQVLWKLLWGRCGVVLGGKDCSA